MWPAITVILKILKYRKQRCTFTWNSYWVTRLLLHVQTTSTQIVSHIVNIIALSIYTARTSFSSKAIFDILLASAWNKQFCKLHYFKRSNLVVLLCWFHGDIITALFHLTSLLGQWEGGGALLTLDIVPGRAQEGRTHGNVLTHSGLSSQSGGKTQLASGRLLIRCFRHGAHQHVWFIWWDLWREIKVNWPFWDTWCRFHFNVHEFALWRVSRGIRHGLHGHVFILKIKLAWAGFWLVVLLGRDWLVGWRERPAFWLQIRVWWKRRGSGVPGYRSGILQKRSRWL